MARPSNAAAQGHNSKAPLTDDEFADLQAFYEIKLRQAEKAADVIKAEYDEARGEVNSWFKRMTADLKYTRKEFAEFLADLDLPERERQAKAARRQRLYTNAGLGTQFALELEADTVDEAIAARLDGARAFKRSDDRIPPKHVSPVLHQDWIAGYDEEMVKVAAQMGRAEEIIERRTSPDADADPVELNEEGEAEAEAGAELPDAEVVEAEARKLKRSGFTKRSGGADDAQAAA